MSYKMILLNTLARNECSGYTDDDNLPLDQLIPINTIRGCTIMTYDNIVKPENDKKSYRIMELINEMRVLLISDPTTKVSAAALDVGVGYMNDPINLQGVAHMVQHLLYSRSDPTSASYKFFTEVERHNGQIDARTTENNTTYYFSVNSDVFMRALGNFSGLFQFPAFKESPYKRKVDFQLDLEIMMHEYDKRHSTLLEKCWTTEITTTIKHTIDENHDFTKNAYNGFEDIWDVNCENLLQTARHFFTEYYSSNIMTLCVYGREHLDVLQKCVSVLFSQIRNVQEPRIAWIIPEFTSVYKIWCSVPENAPWLNYVIRIVFPMCGELTSSRSNALSQFISYLFQHEGKGSLVTVLRKKKWATSVEAGELTCPRGFSFFIVALGLTKKGYKLFDEVMMLFLQYVRILSELSNPELRRIYNEYKEIIELKFRYQKQLSPLEMVCNRVRHIHLMDMDQVLRCDTISKHWLQHGVKHTFQNIFQPSLKLKIYLSHPSTLHKDAVLNMYGRIPCRIKLVVPVEYSKWLNGTESMEMNAPLPNEFIPLRSSLKPHQLDCLYIGESKYLLENYGKRNIPEIIRQTPLITTWYKRNTVFHVPKISAYFHFICPAICDTDFTAYLTSLYVNIINTCLREYKYPASLVDLRWKISATVRGIMIQINGFVNTVHALLRKILGYLLMLRQNVNFKLFFATFTYYTSKTCKENTCKFNNLYPYEQAALYLPYLLTERAWTPHQVWKNDAKITWEKFCSFVSYFIHSFHVECLFHGNMTAVEALNISALVENTITSKLKIVNRSSSVDDPVPEEKFRLNREVKLEDWSQYVLYTEASSHEYSCVLTFFQFNHRSTESDVLLDLALVVLQDASKMIDNFGVTCGRHRGNVMQGLTIVFQCPAKVLKCMKREINDFMIYTITLVNKLTDLQFKEIKKKVIKTYQKPLTLHKISDMYWNELLSQQYRFDRMYSELHYLRTVTRKKFLEFYLNYITDYTPRLSIYVTPEFLFEDFSGKTAWKSDECSCLPTCELTIINNIKMSKSSRFF